MSQSNKIFTALSMLIFITVSFGQINLLSDEITFRTSNDKDEITYHYGNLSLLGLGNAPYSSILYSKYEATIANDKIAVYGDSRPVPYWGIGGRFWGGWKGIEGLATVSGTGSRYGGWFRGHGGSWNNYGIYAEAGGNQGTNIGVYGWAYSASTNYAGYFNGNVHVTGTLTNPSDIKLKKDISPLKGSLNKILKLKPKEYFYKTDEFKSMQLPKTKKAGLIAQEVETIFPELVSEEVMPGKDVDEKGNKIPAEKLKKPEKYKSINYIELIPILIDAMQEQQEEIDIMKSQLGLD